MLKCSIAALALILMVVAATEAKYTGPTNQAGLSLIKHYEGFYANFYKDPVGIRTIGYGHACHVWDCSIPLNGKYRVPLTQSTGEALLKEDLAYPGRYEQCVSKHVTYSNLNANQYSALVSFTFNLGCGNLRSSTLLTKLNRGDVKGAAEEFKRWVHAGGKRLPGLVKRRAAEKDLFCTGGVCGISSSPSFPGASPSSTGCKGVTTAPLHIRSRPSASSSRVGGFSSGATIIITGRSTGTNVRGNANWFKVPTGYVSAYYVNISQTNGANWCAKN